ncbi:hypothetical protein TYM08_P3673 [Marinicellulosiphila megalodicopiae]
MSFISNQATLNSYPNSTEKHTKESGLKRKYCKIWGFNLQLSKINLYFLFFLDSLANMKKVGDGFKKY